MSDWSQVVVPERLRERVPDAPATLWVRGDEELLDIPAIAVVGGRSCSTYGRSVAHSFAQAFAREGYCVLSGLARGIDVTAHRAALDTPDGRTMAVLGCGIDRIYPAAHGEIAERIVLAGAIVSEYAPGTEPAPWRFPARNRIVAGLADAVVVIEARAISGSLITADFALAYGVPVFAVPGEITSALSAGTNDLLRRGVATIAVSPEDVLTRCEVITS